MLSAFFGLILAAASQSSVLHNRSIRVEVEAESATIRFVGTPGGVNFLQAGHFVATDAGESNATPPAGLIVQAIGEDDSLLTPPGGFTMIEHSDVSLTLIGELSDALRLKIEVRFESGASDCRFRVTVLSTSYEPNPIGLRVKATLAPEAMVEPMATGSESGGNEIEIAHEALRWVRRVVPFVEGETTAFAMSINNDGQVHAPNVVLDTPRVNVDAMSPLVFEEVWTVQEAPVGAPTI